MNRVYYGKDDNVFSLDVPNPKEFDSEAEVHRAEFHSKIKTKIVYIIKERRQDEQSNS